jgi:hypothetical protein
VSNVNFNRWCGGLYKYPIKVLAQLGFKSKVLLGPLTDIGLEVQKPTQALMSVKSLGNIFDLNPKWARTLPDTLLWA